MSKNAKNKRRAKAMPRDHKPYRTERWLTDFGALPVTPWMLDRLNAHNERAYQRMSNLVIEKVVGIPVPKDSRL